MREIDPFDGACGATLAGVLDGLPTGRGHRLRRLPGWTRATLLDPAAELMATMPSGAKLDLVTDTSTVELDVKLARVQLGELPARPALFEVVVDGTPAGVQSFDDGDLFVVDVATGAVDHRRGEPCTVRFDLGGGGARRVEVWLAHTASVELRALRVDDDAVVGPPPRSARWVHYGSSISHCMEADRPTHVWPVVAARRAGVELQSLGFAGQCHLDPYVARTIRDLPADAISVKAGINVVNADSMRERTFLAAVQGFLDTVRDGHPTTPLALVSPIICPVAEDHPGPTLSGPDLQVAVVPRSPELAVGSLTLRRIRELLAQVVAARRRAGDEHVAYVDGLELFGPDDLADLPDGLHPNDAGYQRMGERFHRLVFGAGGAFAGLGAGAR